MSRRYESIHFREDERAEIEKWRAELDGGRAVMIQRKAGERGRWHLAQVLSLCVVPAGVDTYGACRPWRAIAHLDCRPGGRRVNV